MVENTAEETEEFEEPIPSLRKVRVKKDVPMVYYNHKRRRTGDVFQLIDRELKDGSILLAEDQFSEKTMEWMRDDTPTSISLGSTARTGEKLIDQEEIQENDTRRPTAIGEARRRKVTRPGRKEEVSAPKKKVKSKALSGSKKEKKDLDPNKTGKGKKEK